MGTLEAIGLWTKHLLILSFILFKDLFLCVHTHVYRCLQRPKASSPLSWSCREVLGLKPSGAVGENHSLSPTEPSHLFIPQLLGFKNQIYYVSADKILLFYSLARKTATKFTVSTRHSSQLHVTQLWRI